MGIYTPIDKDTFEVTSGRVIIADPHYQIENISEEQKEALRYLVGDREYVKCFPHGALIYSVDADEIGRDASFSVMRQEQGLALYLMDRLEAASVVREGLEDAFLNGKLSQFVEEGKRTPEGGDFERALNRMHRESDRLLASEEYRQYLLQNKEEFIKSSGMRVVEDAVLESMLEKRLFEATTDQCQLLIGDASVYRGEEDLTVSLNNGIYQVAYDLPQESVYVNRVR